MGALTVYAPPISHDDLVKLIALDAKTLYASPPKSTGAPVSPLDALSDREKKLVAQRNDLYESLGLSFSATRVDIRAAYRQLVKVNHPDNPANQGLSTGDTMIRINHAWEVLGNPRLREAYDWLQSGER